jgi:predicted DNA-binding antitoxin AbrB/MazE fold protein
LSLVVSGALSFLPLSAWVKLLQEGVLFICKRACHDHHSRSHLENGVLKPKERLALVEGATVRLAISPLDEDHDPLDDVVGICTEGPDISLLP